jgi:hypothetical protein
MIYDLAITVPKNTAKTAPVTEELLVHPGIVKQIDIMFPRGCAGLAHVRIFRSLQQLWPAYEEQSFAGDGFNLSWPEEYHVDDPPYAFDVVCWNDDDTFGHVVTVRMAVLPRDSAGGGGLLMDFFGMFGKLAKGEL